jgi:3-hydroxyisobutyrate dehydrogenase
MTNTLFIGLGRMGRPMVRHIAERFPTWAYDISVQAIDAVVQDTEAEGLYEFDHVQQFNTVILMLPTSKHVEEILLQNRLLDRLNPDALIIDMGSSVPASTQHLSGLSAERGIDYVDAPVSGGISKAESGNLTMLVGGESAAVEKARPYLKAVGQSIVVVGDSGAGHAAKAINNLVSATNIAVASEAVLRAQAAGIAPERMIEVLNASTGMSQATQVKFPNHILPGTYSSNFAYDLMLKDMAIAMNIDVADEASQLTKTAFDVLSQGRSLLGENADHTEITRVYEHLSNRPIKK